MTPTDQLIDLVNNHPDATAMEGKTYWSMTLKGRHSIHLGVLKKPGTSVHIIKECEDSTSDVTWNDDKLHKAVMQRISEILMPNPLTDILKDFK